MVQNPDSINGIDWISIKEGLRFIERSFTLKPTVSHIFEMSIDLLLNTDTIVLK
jgi:hypothetical protein